MKPRYCQNCQRILEDSEEDNCTECKEKEEG